MRSIFGNPIFSLMFIFSLFVSGATMSAEANRKSQEQIEKESVEYENQRSRAIGAFIGLAIGDALGTTLE